MEGRVGFDLAITLLFIGQKSATFAANRVEEFYMATNYFFKVFLGDLDNQGNARKQWIGFDTTFIVAGSDVKVQDHDVESEQDGRNELVRITTFKRFAAVVNDSADIHTIHTLFLLEQTKAAVATDIEFYKWDDKVKPDKQGNASVISLAKVVSNSKITSHSVTLDEDAYWFRFELVSPAEFNELPEKKGK
jgi:hypothetical protein